MHVTLFCGKLGNGLIPAVVEVNRTCHLHHGPKTELLAHNTNSMVTNLPRLTAEQLDLIKYAVLSNITVSRLKDASSIIMISQSLAHSPQSISTELQ